MKNLASQRISIIFNDTCGKRLNFWANLYVLCCIMATGNNVFALMSSACCHLRWWFVVKVLMDETACE